MFKKVKLIMIIFLGSFLLGGCSYLKKNTSSNNNNIPTDNEPKAEIFTGEGTSGNPYVINNINHLLYLADSVDNEKNSYQGCSFILDSDIDMNGYDWKPIGGEFAWGKVEFMGNFDGNGHTISNYKITRSWTRQTGLFGCCANNTISNISIKNATIELDMGHFVVEVGLIVGHGNNSQFDNCTAEGNINVSTDAGQQNIGGVVGYLYTSSTVLIIKDCKSAITITSNSAYPNVGGIAGRTTNTNVIACETKSNIEYTSIMATANTTGTYRTYNGIGGLVGVNLRGDIRDCTVNTNILGGGGSVWVVGGLIGYSESAVVENCHVTGSIKRKNTNSDISSTSELISSGRYNKVNENCTCEIICEVV